MTVSSLATRIIPCSMRSIRQGAAIDHFLGHHQAGTDSEAVARAMTTGSRATSSNYVITNEGEIWGVVPEEFRAWTSGSNSDGGKGAAWDRRSITVEVENDVNGEPWTISVAAQNAVARLMADVSARYGFPLTRDSARSTVFGHRELWEYFRASYPTRCPGGMDLDAIVALANSGTSGEEIMEIKWECVLDDGVFKKGKFYIQESVTSPVRPLDPSSSSGLDTSAGRAYPSTRISGVDLTRIAALYGPQIIGTVDIDYAKLGAAVALAEKPLFEALGLRIDALPAEVDRYADGKKQST